MCPTLAKLDKWQKAQASLYDQIGQQLNILSSAKDNGNGQTANGNGRIDATPGHYCQEHGVAFKRHDKDGRMWYSHKLNGGKWCNEHR
jgi:hypothetical protein